MVRDTRGKSHKRTAIRECLSPDGPEGEKKFLKPFPAGWERVTTGHLLIQNDIQRPRHTGRSQILHSRPIDWCSTLSIDRLHETLL